MRKRLTALAALLLAMSVPMGASAETFYGGDSWGVVFDGTQMDSTFTNAEIEDTIYQMQPGDTAEIHLSLRNDYNGNTDWYMTNQVLQSLEDSQSVAEGGAYAYILTYINPEGESELLYSSEEIGGETVNESGEGLYQATDSLEDYFYLDTLESGEAGEITLSVHLEGETQGNDYQDTLARLQMNFAVELPAATPSDEDGGNGGGSGGQSGTSSRARVAKTGDTTNVMLFSVLTLAAGLLCLILAVVRLRNRKAQGEETGGSGRAGKETHHRRRRTR